jgi:DNA polymerase-3 subunit epsilon
VRQLDPCGCFPSGRHYPGIAHLVRARWTAPEFEATAAWSELPIALLDVETTGRDPVRDRIVEIGIVVGRAGEVERVRGWLVNPGIPIPAEVSAVHGITDADVASAPSFAELASEVLAALEGVLPAAYNAGFDRGFLLAEFDRAQALPSAPPPALRRGVEWLDPLVLARELYKNESSRALGDMARILGVELERAHRATDDALAALRVLWALGRDPRVPASYGALVQEQRRLSLAQEQQRAMWRKS